MIILYLDMKSNKLKKENKHDQKVCMIYKYILSFQGNKMQFIKLHMC